MSKIKLYYSVWEYTGMYSNRLERVFTPRSFLALSYMNASRKGASLGISSTQPQRVQTRRKFIVPSTCLAYFQGLGFITTEFGSALKYSL